MCKFLTGSARIQQTNRRRIWRLLDNEVFLSNKGELLLAPRNMLSDNYTIPLWISFIAGSPVDFDTRGSHIHDELCYCREALIINLTVEELKEKGYLRFSEKNNMWVCEDVPAEFLKKRKVTKLEANNILYGCMEASGVPLLNRIIIRLGVVFNIGWFIDYLLGRVFKLDLDRVYTKEYWDENVRRK